MTARGVSLAEALVLAQIAWLAEELTSLRARVLALCDRLPAALQETAEEDTTAPDIWSEIRSVLRCVVADRLTPAIEDLLAVARRAAEVDS